MTNPPESYWLERIEPLWSPKKADPLVTGEGINKQGRFRQLTDSKKKTKNLRKQGLLAIYGGKGVRFLNTILKQIQYICID